jgi:phosphoglycerol transferase
MVEIRRDSWAQVRTAFLVGIISCAVVFVRLALWRYDLTAPLTYWGDALYETVLVKGLTEGAWNYHIARLGAPFGMDTVDFPIGCLFDFSCLKLLSLMVQNPFLLINLYWLLSVGFAAVVATRLLEYLRVARLWAATFGILYAVIPWVFFRNIAHLNLVHFIAPAGAYLGLSLAQFEPAVARKSFKSVLLVGLPVCAVTGLTYIYWSFFACILVGIGSLMGVVRTRSWVPLLIGSVYIITIGLFAMADVSGSLMYWYHYGSNVALNYKHVTDPDFYALRIRQLLSPIPDHPFPLFRRIPQALAAARFPNDDNESAWSALGTFGVLGFLGLIAVATLRPSRGIFGDERMRVLAAFVIALILIGQVGGFGSVFNLFVMHEFRCYNRLSPFISLFSLAAVALGLDCFLAKKPGYIKVPVAAAVIVFGALDQIPCFIFQLHSQEVAEFYHDREFIRRLEEYLPRASMVFQLPNTPFPLDGMTERMLPYDNARAYLHSKSLRFSWGAMEGRHADWAKNTASLPTPELLHQLSRTAFSGILIDRWGYPDGRVEREIAERLGVPALSEPRARWVFYDLRTLQAGPPQQSWAKPPGPVDSVAPTAELMAELFRYPHR